MCTESTCVVVSMDSMEYPSMWVGSHCIVTTIRWVPALLRFWPALKPSTCMGAWFWHIVWRIIDAILTSYQFTTLDIQQATTHAQLVYMFGYLCIASTSWQFGFYLNTCMSVHIYNLMEFLWKTDIVIGIHVIINLYIFIYWAIDSFCLICFSFIRMSE